MKHLKLKFTFLLVLMMMSGFAVQAQTTMGKDFRLVFGTNENRIVSSVDLQIKVAATTATNVIITFTGIPGDTIRTSLAAGAVYTLALKDNPARATAVYIAYDATGVSSKSLRIESDQPVTVYALNRANTCADATNVLPVNALGKEYYHISYIPSTNDKDGYNIVATEDETIIYENNTRLNTTPLNAGQVWSVLSTSKATDLTGRHITANKPIACFSACQGAVVPKYENGNSSGLLDVLYQQMLPVRTWGKNFCIPITKRGVERVRVVASQDGTIITQQGGAVKGGSMTLDKGQFLELEAVLSRGGCYISANKPVGVCSFMVADGYNTAIDGVNTGRGDACIAWVSPVEQFIDNATIAPFFPNGSTNIANHYALIVMPTEGREQATLSIGGATPAALSTGSWKTCPNPKYSFYNMELTQSNKTYNFVNPKGLLVLGYGLGPTESYYYLSGSSTRDLEAAFYVNGEHYLAIDGREFVNIKEFHINAILENVNSDPGFLKWYIDGVLQPTATDQLEWDVNLPPGPHTIRMEVVDLNYDIKTYETTITHKMVVPVNHSIRRM